MDVNNIDQEIGMTILWRLLELFEKSLDAIDRTAIDADLEVTYNSRQLIQAEKINNDVLQKLPKMMLP